jgi:hypothetical protein
MQQNLKKKKKNLLDMFLIVFLLQRMQFNFFLVGILGVFEVWLLHKPQLNIKSSSVCVYVCV